MFERYTERARRVIFFARFEASRLGVLEITPEHLALALFREDAGLRGMVPSGAMEQIRRAIESETRAGDKISTSVDLPLSAASKRILAHAAEESDRLSHGHIGTSHMLIGLLREPSRAAELLVGHGVTLERAREAASAVPKAAPGETPEPDTATRASLHQMLDALPEDKLLQAVSALLHTRQARPPIPSRLTEARERMIESLRAFGGTGMIGGGPMAAAMMAGQRETTIESHRFHHGHEITLIERLRLSDDGKTLHIAIEVRGPKGSQTWSGDFDVS